MHSNDLNERIYPAYPRIGVGVLVVHDNKCLLVKRGREPAKNQWSLPGGLVEIGETLESAAKRELLEECGIQIELLSNFYIFEFIESSKNRIKFHFVVIDYLAKYKSGELKAESDIDDADWFSIHEIDQLFASAEIKSVVKLGFAKYNECAGKC